MNWALFQNSLLVASLTTLVAVGIGIAAALCVSSLERRMRWSVLACGALALVLPPFLVTNSWIFLLGETGIWRDWFPLKLYSIWGTVWVLSLLLWPIAMFLIAGAWRRIELAQLESEPLLRGRNCMRWLLLPSARPAIAQSAVLIFVLAFNNFAVPAILQTRVFPAELWIQFSTTFDYGAAVALSIPLVLPPALLLVWLGRRGVQWPSVQGPVTPRQFRRRAGEGLFWAGAAITFGAVGFSVAVPLVQLFGAAGTWKQLAPAFQAGQGAFWNSLGSAAIAATLIIGLGVALRSRGWVGALWIWFLAPGIFLGITLTFLLNRPGLHWIYQSFGIVILGLGLRYFGPGWTGARHALESTDPDLYAAARLAGATRWQRFRHVYWPQAGAMLAAIWYIVFLLCLWDAETMVLIVPPGGETLALRTFNLLHYGYTGQVNALCALLLGVALLPGIAWLAIRTVRRWISNPAAHPGLIAGALAAIGVLGAGCGSDAPGGNATIDSRFFGSVQIIGSRGTGPGQFNKPRSLALDRDDNLYVVDMTGRVQKFSPNGDYLLSWQMPQTEKGKPKGMGCDPSGNIVLIEPHYARINHFSADGKLQAQWGTFGTNEGQLTLPRAIAFNSKGEAFVAQYTRRERVQAFSRDAEFLFGFGNNGSEAGGFNRPEGICFDAEDRIYIADSCNHRVQVFSPAGEFLMMYGEAGNAPGELSYPYDVKLDAEGHAFVCEFGNSRVQVFDANGHSVEVIGGAGSAPGQFSNPWALAFDSKGNLYVADGLNHRVQKFIRRRLSSAS